MAGYSIYVRPDLLQVFWAGMQAGDFITDAVAPINTSRRTRRRVLVEGCSEFGEVPVLLGRKVLSRTSYFGTSICVWNSNCRCVGHVLHVAGSSILGMSSILWDEVQG